MLFCRSLAAGFELQPKHFDVSSTRNVILDFRMKSVFSDTSGDQLKDVRPTRMLNNWLLLMIHEYYRVSFVLYRNTFCKYCNGLSFRDWPRACFTPVVYGDVLHRCFTQMFYTDVWKMFKQIFHTYVLNGYSTQLFYADVPHIVWRRCFIQMFYTDVSHMSYAPVLQKYALHRCFTRTRPEAHGSGATTSLTANQNKSHIRL